MHTLTADKVSRPEASESVDLSVGSVRSPSHPETHTRRCTTLCTDCTVRVLLTLNVDLPGNQFRLQHGIKQY